MSDYRRWFIPGGMYFFTVVTYGRRPILGTALGRTCLRQALETTRAKRPFDLFANVLMPDHWHFIIQLPSGDEEFSVRIKRVKEEFTRAWLKAGGKEAKVTAAQAANGERGVWQPRFWEHAIQDVEDLESHVDYIHWNPCKHRVVERVNDWEWSSFHRFVSIGHYTHDWGRLEPGSIRKRTEWGEPI